jgi:hypothetical protein
MKKAFVLLASHLLAAFIGFAAGIYILPIWTAPPAPTPADVKAASDDAEYSGQFRRDLAGSDALHWGEGAVYVGRKSVAVQGRVSPGPDYKLYLSPEFVDTEADFERIKPGMVRVGDVKTFENFIVPMPGSIDPSAYTTVIVWCESFNQFITSARYR